MKQIDLPARLAKAFEQYPGSEEQLRQKMADSVEMDPNSGCWLWAGAATGMGYGSVSIKIDGRYFPHTAHRVSFYLATGKDPGELDLCHRCDTTLCVNPSHLFIGTRKDNLRDAVSKGRMAKASPQIARYILHYKDHPEHTPQIIAKKLGMPVHFVMDVQAGKRWKKHLSRS